MSNEDNDVTVIGIDPAPGKKSVVFDGQVPPKELDANCLNEKLWKLKEEHEKLLICWDAPLTGPSSVKGKLKKGDLTQRSIETFFRNKKYWKTTCGGKIKHCKPPAGNSVLPYSGCSHWTISRRLLRLPVMGPYDGSKRPFKLIHAKQNTWNGHYIAEVHPAVAIWLWLKDNLDGTTYQLKDGTGKKWSWKYKGKKKEDRPELILKWGIILDGLFAAIKTYDCCREGQDILQKDEQARGFLDPNKANFTDDHLDAFVAWLLGKLWVSNKGNEGDVRMLGNSCTGSFLLPYHEDVFDRWKDYYSKQKKRICPNETE